MRWNVLLVDDMESARISFAALLEDAGHRVVEAGSIAEGRAHAAREQFELALVDLGLPDGDGAQLVLELSQLPQAPVVVVLSGAEVPEIAGARLCLQKGSDPVAMLAALARTVGARE